MTQHLDTSDLRTHLLGYPSRTVGAVVIDDQHHATGEMMAQQGLGRIALIRRAGSIVRQAAF